MSGRLAKRSVSKSVPAVMTPINYAEFDCEIRVLVELMNRVQGLHTLCSCAGHADGEESAIAFQCDLKAFMVILLAIPERNRTELFNNNRLHWANATVDAAMTKSEGIIFTLRVNGEPRFYQRLFLYDIEARLISLLETRPPCSTYALGRGNGDN